jgi:hypothetical protein
MTKLLWMRESGERQHHDGEMRGRNLCARRDVRRPVRAQVIPGAREGDKRCGDRCEGWDYPQKPFSIGGLCARRRLSPGRRINQQRIDPDWPFDVLELRQTKISNRHVQPSAHLAVSILGQADRSGLGDAFQSRGDIDAVAHQIAVALLDDVAEVNADAEGDAAIFGDAGVAVDQRVLDFDRAAHGVDDAAELDEQSVAGALNDAPVMHGDCRVDEVTAQRPQPRQDGIFVRAGEPAIADHVRAKDRRKFPRLAHSAYPAAETSTEPRREWL